MTIGARVVLLLGLTTAVAPAAVLFYSDYDSNRSDLVRLNVETSPGNVSEVADQAGVMSIQVDGGPAFDAFCGDLFTGIASNTTYQTAVFSAGSAPYTRVAWLIANVLPTIVSGGVAGRQQGAALQVAIWEVIHDNGDGLGAGLIQANVNTDAAVQAYVSSYLSMPWSPVAGLTLYQNVFPGTSFAAQDLVAFSTAVPEPSMAVPSALLLIAFAMGLRYRQA